MVGGIRFRTRHSNLFSFGQKKIGSSRRSTSHWLLEARTVSDGECDGEHLRSVAAAGESTSAFCLENSIMLHKPLRWLRSKAHARKPLPTRQSSSTKLYLQR